MEQKTIVLSSKTLTAEVINVSNDNILQTLLHEADDTLRDSDSYDELPSVFEGGNSAKCINLDSVIADWYKLTLEEVGAKIADKLAFWGVRTKSVTLDESGQAYELSVFGVDLEAKLEKLGATDQIIDSLLKLDREDFLNELVYDNFIAHTIIPTYEFEGLGQFSALEQGELATAWENHHKSN